nr:DUF6194 family protein [Saccharopolyspora hordei]
MTETAIIEHTQALPGVVAITADAASGAPEIAWGDTFFHHAPEGRDPADRDLPFATIVTKDYPGFDTESKLDRPGIYRLNVNVGRAEFQRLLGHTPAEHPAHHDEHDYSAVDEVLPHPVYAPQGWISILNPGPRTAEQALQLLTAAHARAARRHRPADRSEP